MTSRPRDLEDAELVRVANGSPAVLAVDDFKARVRGFIGQDLFRLFRRHVVAGDKRSPQSVSELFCVESFFEVDRRRFHIIYRGGWLGDGVAVLSHPSQMEFD